MRKCLRCGVNMVEGFGVRVNGGAWKLSISEDDSRLFGGDNMGTIKAAVCPECGEVSVYLENYSKIRKKIQMNEDERTY